MDIVGFITSQNLFDLLFVFILFAAFIVGFIQGTIRRLLGIASILFSFLLAANVRDPLGKFLAENWTQFAPDYAYMLGFLGVFVIASIGFSIVIQGFYERTPLLANAALVDEVVGGILGVLQALLVFGGLIVILDSAFRAPGSAIDADELPFLRNFFDAYTTSGLGQAYRETLIPLFFGILGWIVPDGIEKLYSKFGG